MTDDVVDHPTETATAADLPGTPEVRATSPTEEREVFELLSTILLALAAIATALAGFQSAKWGGVQATNFSQAGAARTESVRFSTLAGQEAQVDITTFLSWLDKVVADIDSGAILEPTAASEYEPTPATLSGFTFARFREEFGPAVDAWLAT